MSNGIPLFITRFSLSQKTAIGVQTKILLSVYDEWRHFYWSTPQLMPAESQSRCIESKLFSRLSALKPGAGLSDRLGKLGFGWWDGNVLRRRRQSALHQLRQISSVYVAPLDRRDAARMRHLVALMGKPFVVHLWDLLDGSSADDDDLRWLLQNSVRNFCLTAPMIAEVERIGAQAEYLMFSRPPSKFSAKEPSNGDVRIALIGNIGSYKDGVALLLRAVSNMKARGVSVTVVFVGPKSIPAGLGPEVAAAMEITGFIENSEEKDRILSMCSVAYLPGPLQSPEMDARSKYSLPSRVLDFLAVGLPIIGTVHEDSAMWKFCSGLNVGERLACGSPEDVEEALLSVGEPLAWATSSERCRKAFGKLEEQDPPGRLKTVLQAVPAGERAIQTHTR